MARSSLRDRQREGLRTELREAAIAMFLSQGFDSVSVTDIAEQVGIVQRTFYRHFATKEDAVLSVLDDFAPLVHAHVRNHAGGDLPWKVLLAAMVNATAQSARVDADVVRMIFETPKLEAAFYDRQRVWAKMVAEVLAERLKVDLTRDPRPILWAKIAFEITAHTSYENTVLNPLPDPLTHLEERFVQASELFSGVLP